ncbi:MAG: hypothetical protein A2Z83_03565 [Omnitrophica bacterium GWA2_52_8]|nr:MAG: hypothetical protein A2Z83_03565 [Omnitrophica bacterium GWA2_52_8]
MKTSRYLAKTALGVFEISIGDRGVERLSFPRHQTKRAHKIKQKTVKKNKKRDRIFRICQALLRRYCRGEKVRFNRVPFDFSGRSSFQIKILTQLSKVPYGQTVSYHQLSRMSGCPGADRAVGNAMGGNPIPVMVPCHRVVRKNGAIGKYSGGVSWKKRLLALEGRLD